MDRCIIAHSSNKLGTAAFNDILAQLENNGESINPILVLFASDCSNFGWYSRMLADCYKGAVVMGMTTEAQYYGDSFSQTGLTVMAITEGIRVSCGVLCDASRFPKRYESEICEAFMTIGTDINTVCLEFNSSMLPCEEIVMDTFESVIGNTNVKMCGATAKKGENPERPSAVSLNGVVYNDAAVFAFIHNKNGEIEVIKENIFTPTETTFTVTDVDCNMRRVYEFDHMPAAVALAKAMKITPSEVSKQGFYHPIGRLKKDDLDVKGIDSINEDGSIDLYSLLYNQTKVNLLEPVESVPNIWEDTAKRVHEKIKDPSFSIVLNCNSRTKYFMELGINGDFARKLHSEYKDYIGFSADGEQMNYRHLNQTMVMMVFE